MKILDIIQSFNPVAGGEKIHITNKMRHLASRRDFEHAIIVPARRNRLRTEY
jgi:hypothetical protein